MKTTSQIANAIGRKRMAAALGVGETAVSNAVVRGQFPASWFLVLRDLSASLGLDCPADLFGMRPLDSTQYVELPGDCQDLRNNAEKGM